mgnify:CR=1 FL=1|jgi:N-acetylmuramoyl-L-alanine amidase
MIKYIVLLLFLFFSSSIIAEHTIIFQNNSTKANILTISKKNTVFISSFDLKTPLSLSITKSYKHNGYYFRFSSKSLLITPGSKEVWLNNTRHYLSERPFIKNSRLFVPFDDFLFLLGLSRTISETTSSIIKLNSHPLLTPVSPYVSFERKEFFKPISAVSKDSHLVYKNNALNLSKFILKQNNTTYFNPAQFFKTLSYKVTSTDSLIKVTYNKFSYTFDLNSRIWSGKHNEKSWNFLAETPIIKHNNDYYFPINSFFSFLDYTIFFNSISASFELLDNIHSISFYNSSVKKGINIVSRHSLSYSLDLSSDNPLKQTLIIPFSKSFNNKKKTPYFSNLIDSLVLSNKYLTFEQLDSNKNFNSKNNSKLLISMKKPFSFFPQKSSSGLYLSMKKMLSDVTISKYKSRYKITLSGTNIDSPKIYKENNMLICDFNNTINALDRLKKINDYNFRSFRSSQLSTTPLKSRFVLDFNNSIPEFNIKKSKDSIIITFNSQAPKKSIASVSKKNTYSKKIKKSKTSRTNLRNKIIILDPGHGGVDPGAIVDRTLYEKRYTLDIAKRVQVLLEKEGAYVILTRSSDATKSLHSRVKLANKQNADLFLSIHLNSFKNSKVSGSQSFYSKSKDKKLAQHIQKQISHDFNTKNNGIRRSRFFVLRHTKMPSTLLEPLFMTNKKEKNQLLKPAYRSKLANSIFLGVKNYYKDS